MPWVGTACSTHRVGRWKDELQCGRAGENSDENSDSKSYPSKPDENIWWFHDSHRTVLIQGFPAQPSPSPLPFQPPCTYSLPPAAAKPWPNLAAGGAPAVATERSVQARVEGLYTCRSARRPGQMQHIRAWYCYLGTRSRRFGVCAYFKQEQQTSSRRGGLAKAQLRVRLQESKSL